MDTESSPYIRFRLGNIDSYQSSPTTYDQDFSKVPVIRIWGAADESGQKICCHVHGVYPYCYVEYSGNLVPDEVDAYIRKLHASIDLSMSLSYQRNPHDSKANTYVARITLCKGVPIYGFHVGWSFFLKIYMLNPGHMQRLADLLRSGNIMGRKMQPYEVHIPYLLQFMSDYGLYGCGWVECRTVTFRAPVPAEDETMFEQSWNESTIPQHLITSTDDKPRLSHCSVEIDLLSHNILNRRTIKPRLLHHDFVERTNPIPLSEKLVHSMAELWRDDERRRAQKGDERSTPSHFTSASDETWHKGPWIHEAELRQQLENLIQTERNKSDMHTLSFDTFVKPTRFESMVQTALESVTDMFPPELPSSSQKRDNYVGVHTSSGHVREDSNDFPRPEVDEHLASELSEANIENISGQGSVNGEEYYSDRTEESASDIDFDGDALDNGEHITLSTILERGVSFSGQHNALSDLDSLDLSELSDDIDLDHDMGSPSRRTSANFGPSFSSENIIRELTGARDLKSSSHSNGRPQEPLRLRGGASTPQKRKQSSLDKSAKDESHKRLRVKNNSVNSNEIESVVSVPKDRKVNFSSPNPSFPFSSKELQDLENPEATTDEATGPKRASMNRYPSAETRNWIAPRKRYSWKFPPPHTRSLLSSLHKWNVPRVIPRSAFYSKDEDVPCIIREYAGREFKLVSKSLPHLERFHGGHDFTASIVKDSPQISSLVLNSTTKIWQFQYRAPLRSKLGTAYSLGPGKLRTNFAEGEDHLIPGLVFFADGQVMQSKNRNISQIEGVTQKNKFGFKFSQNKKQAMSEGEMHYMSIMSIEVHVNTRGSLLPNPEEDSIVCIFWSIEIPQYCSVISGHDSRMKSGLIIIHDRVDARHELSIDGCRVDVEDSELDLINRLVDVVREFDPDILTGYEVQSSSWGYIIERGRLHYEFDLCDELSRMKSMSYGRFGRENDRWGFTQASMIRVTGRHMINIWRAMRGELNLTQYTLENVTFHLLHRRIPHYSHSDLTRWYSDPLKRRRVLRYYMSRCLLNIEMLEAQELIPRVCEQARILGIDFYSVFSRGSQFKVESLMVRIAKAECFMLISPSRKQVGQQDALECIPLVMEPRSDFYPGPLLVLDFQSLYPSIIIAYNYCYSTCLGRIQRSQNQNKLGFTNLELPERLLELLKDDVNVAPNGLVFAKTSIRRAVLSKMLSEILDTRVMVKSSMNLDQNDKSFVKLQNNRQLALKYIANVTYGYTSATFSGRMPCAEIADSIVQTGRETLEKAIEVIHSNSKWDAEVVYGDTDSLFVYVPGRTRDEAFDIGEDIAATITRINPGPIKLKFEKVYHPCVLLAKKRYVGFKYEKRTTTTPVFDAKGIETVRRDGTPAQQKIEEAALKILFRTSDLSLVKDYFQRQCLKILSNRVSIQDFCFAKEVKLGTYSENGVPPPGAIISARKMLNDPRAEPQYGERVPYVVRAGAPGARLVDRVVSPEEMLNDKNMRLDAEYYISKTLIPPLERIFNLVGANVRSWYEEMRKIQIRDQKGGVVLESLGRRLNGSTIHAFMKSRMCTVCEIHLTDDQICDECRNASGESIYILSTGSQVVETGHLQLQMVCSNCCGIPLGEEVACDSRDCPVFYARIKAASRLQHVLFRDNAVLNDLELW